MSQINESAIKTPGVYINEIPSFPPSVAQVATAIPAFIGYTDIATANGENVLNTPYRIESMAEYQSVFGGDYIHEAGDITIQLDIANSYALDNIVYVRRYLMFDSIRQFFDNGGSRCYVVSVGLYGEEVESGDESDPAGSPGLRVGVKALEVYDEPTLILFPDAAMLDDETDYYSLQQMAIEQCAKLQDRFSILDIKENIDGNTWEDNVQSFRDNIGINSLNYAAVYTPWIYSTYEKEIDFEVLDGHVTDIASTPVVINLAVLPVDSTYNDLVTTLQNNTADVTNVQDTIDTLCDDGTTEFTSLLDRFTIP
ncbi:MAG: hypothetical protein IPM38_13155 [Ignavibacteria bacterium]|nr:hypothetical protein [Ignavibacteria bacterium]